jgi:Mn-containing catalase
VATTAGHTPIPGDPVILRIDRLGTELPPPSDPDPNGASVIQELLGGRFGEMSTFMNYTFQSFNFRGRQKRGPSTT